MKLVDTITQPSENLYPVWKNDYIEIEQVLNEIDIYQHKRTIFISGSADTYHPFREQEAHHFLHQLGYKISENGNKIISGYGLGVGGAILNGVLENMINKSAHNLNNYIILRPFPRSASSSKPQDIIWKEYRENFISQAGFAIFLFGNKNKGQELSQGMEEEFKIAVSHRLHIIPVGATGYMAQKIWQEVNDNFENYYPNNNALRPVFNELGNTGNSPQKLIDAVINLISLINQA